MNSQEDLVCANTIAKVVKISDEYVKSKSNGRSMAASVVPKESPRINEVKALRRILFKDKPNIESSEGKSLAASVISNSKDNELIQLRRVLFQK